MTTAVQEAQATPNPSATERAVPSHEELSAAWDKAQAKSSEEVPKEPEKKAEGDVPPEPPKEPEKKEPETPDEDLPHGEKSRLGRKLKKLLESDKQKDATIRELMSKVDALTGSINTLAMGKKEEPEDPDALISRKDLQAILDRQKDESRLESTQKEAQREEYQNGYVNELLKLFDADDVDDLAELSGEKAELYKMLTGETEFNQVHTGNPKVDFKINCQAAEIQLLKKKDTRKPPLRQEEAKGTGVAGEGKETVKADKGVDVSKLDAKAREFLSDIRRRGGDPEALLKRTFG